MKSKNIVEKLQKLISSSSSAAAEASPGPIIENGLTESEINGVTLNQLGNEYVSTILEPAYNVVIKPFLSPVTQ